MTAILYFVSLNKLAIIVFLYREKLHHCHVKNIVPLILTCLLLLICTAAFAQQKITGVVLNENNLPVAGANMALTNSTITAVSLSDGTFEINAKNGDVLLISCIGYKTLQAVIGAETNLKINLQTTAVTLDDLVVTGYTAQKAKEITGSVAIVKPKDLVAVPAGQVEQMLQGRVAGLTVITTGEPGAPANIRLHGIGNFGDVTPLYIIDGIQADINTINPYDIESLQVLKDAGAYSIYGVRGANGVIIVTTRKGKIGKTKIKYDSYIGQQQPLKGLHLLSPQENANLEWLAQKNSGQVRPSDPLYGNGPTPVLPDYLFAGIHQDTLYKGSPYVDPNLYNLNPDNPPIYQIVPFNKSGTDWFHELYQPALSHDHNLTVSGGNEKNLYLFSLGYLDQHGTLLNTYLKRFTLRVNTQYHLGNAVLIGENLQLSYTENPTSNKFNPPVSGTSDAYDALLTNPAAPVYDIKGGYNGGYGINQGPDNNPVARRIFAKDNKGETWQALGNFFGEFNFLKNFTARTNFGGNLTNYYNYNFAHAGYYYPNVGSSNSFSESSGNVKSWTWTNTFSYSGIIGKYHSLHALIGAEIINNYSRENGGQAFNLPFTNPSYWLLTNGDPLTKTNYSIASTTKLQSFFTQIEYGFKERYFITGTLRNDGSSVFGPENRYGWFPSVGAAWLVTEENFLNNSNWLTSLKLRGSWGKTGFYGNTDPANQFTLYGGSAGDAYYDIYGVSSGAIQRGYRTIRLGNAKTGWQEDVVTDIGLESTLWKGKLSITADWYNKTSKGLLFPIALPYLLGDVTPPNVNIGNINNKGIDITLGSRGSFSKNCNWDLLLTYSHYKNKIVQLNQVPYFFDFGWVKNEVGYPISSFYGYKIIGFFKDSADVNKSPKQDAAAPGRFKFADVNGYDASGKLTGKPDGVINDADRIHMGNPNPKYTLGINIGLTYKNFDFSTFLYGAFGNDVLNLNRMALDIASIGSNVHGTTALYDTWTPQNNNAKAPIAEASANFSNNPFFTTYTLEDGTYLRNKSMILGFTFPQKFLKKIKFDRLRVYIQVVNLFTITNYSGLDPELSGTGASPLSTIFQKSSFGIDTGNFPNNQKQFLFGINLGL